MGAHVAPADQQNLAQTMMIGGGSGPLNIAVLKALAGSSTVCQFSEDFQFQFGQGICSFRHGGVYALHAALKTALVAVSAPMTQL